MCRGAKYGHRNTQYAVKKSLLLLELKMKTTSLTTILFGAALSVAAISSIAAPSTPTDLLGDSVPVTAAADRVIHITPDTRYINVVGGQTVRFDVNGQSFAWDFDGSQSAASFDLNRIAPAGALDHPVKAYVSVNPSYEG
jgi:ABC-type Fe3+-hydroxamate transport system substrate-binding protein